MRDSGEGAGRNVAEPEAGMLGWGSWAFERGSTSPAHLSKETNLKAEDGETLRLGKGPCRTSRNKKLVTRTKTSMTMMANTQSLLVQLESGMP